MKLNLGCGSHGLPGFTNVDMHDSQADVIGDIRELDFEDVDEVRMDHILEHLPAGDVLPTLRRIRSWMRPGGRITVEVPDMAAIFAMGCSFPMWVQYVYGAQIHDGEFHRCGFNGDMLAHSLEHAGFDEVRVTAFLSKNPVREAMPCVTATGVA